jgi:hypothetical protein
MHPTAHYTPVQGKEQDTQIDRRFHGARARCGCASLIITGTETDEVNCSCDNVALSVKMMFEHVGCFWHLLVLICSVFGGNILKVSYRGSSMSTVHIVGF